MTRRPTVTIDKASTQADPTNTSPIHFTVVFSEAVSDFATRCDSQRHRRRHHRHRHRQRRHLCVTVSGMTQDGTVIASLRPASPTTTPQWPAPPPPAPTTRLRLTRWDDRDHQSGSTQTDPTSVSPIHFTVVFSEAVSDFATGDVPLGGTARATDRRRHRRRRHL